MRPGRAPWLARVLLPRLLEPGERAVVESDLAELRAAREARDGRRAAERWYRRESVRFALVLLLARVRAFPATVRPTSVGGIGGRDVRQAARTLRRSPVMALAIVSTLALGFGGAAALWAAVDAVLVRPLPYAAPERLVQIHHAVHGNRWGLSVVDWEAIRSQQTQLSAVGASRAGMVTLTRDGASERVRARAVTPGWFEALGVRPALGRAIVEADSRAGAAPTVLLGHGFWQRRLGGSADVVGTTLRLDGVEREVIGVLPPAGPLEERYDVFPALQLEPPTRKGPFFLTVIGRMERGATRPAVEAELRAINARIFPRWQSSWQDRTATYGVQSVPEWVTGPVRRPLLALLGAVGFVLLVATLNAANLLVARAVERRRELSVRLALGASRGRIAGQLVTESALVTFAGLAAGLVLAAWAIAALVGGGPDLLPRSAEITLLHPHVLGVIAMLGAGCALFCGLLPTAQALALSDPARGLGDGSRSVSGGRATERVRRMLVGAQFAIAAPLLVGAGLMLHGFVRLQQVDAGVDAAHVVTAGIALPRERYGDQAALRAFWDALIPRVEALPGVTAAGLSNGRPPRDNPGSNNFDLLDRPTPPDRSQPGAVWLQATPGYFHAMGIPLVAGRLLDARDGADSPPVVVVDEAWARAFYPGEDAIGRRFVSGGCTGEACVVSTVVGVVGDVKYSGLDDGLEGGVQGTIYEPAAQTQPSFAYLFVRSARPATELVPAIRELVHALDADVPLFDVAPAERLVEDALATPRNLLLLAAGFAGVALLLAVIAIYGVMAYFVQRHRRDIGIRLALGAAAGSVTWLIVRRGMAPVLAGTVVGALLAAGTARALSAFVFDVRATDPATHLGVLGLLLGTALLACLLPAWRATRERPLSALRED